MTLEQVIRRPTKLTWAALFFTALPVLAILMKSHLDPEAIANQLVVAKGVIERHAGLSALAFAVVYVIVTGLSLPGAAMLSLLGGFLFGLWQGTVLVSFASVAGATIAMVVARYFLRDTVERRFPEVVARIDRGITADGARYLFALRLVPAIPFFLINLAVGLTRMPVVTFAWVSQLGALPATIVYVNAGRQLALIRHPEQILSPRVILAFVALGAMPFVAKAGRGWWNRRAALRAWKRPQRFDYNLIVIGGGSAGLVSAYIAAAARARVALIEQDKMGGDCLNTGCVPSKALIRSAKLAKEGRHPEDFGLTGRLEPDFPAIARRIHQVIARVAPHDSADRYRALGADVVKGRARVVDPWTVEVDGRRLTSRRIVIATGAEPAIPPIPGLERMDPLTSETLWGLSKRPDRLLVIGGGAIGCELAQSFARLGSRTILVEALPRLLAREDEEVGRAMQHALERDGILVITGIGVELFRRSDEGPVVRLADGREMSFDRVIVAVGRRPRTQGFGLEELGLLEDGRLVLDDRLRTRLPTIYAAGDVAGRLQFTHAAGHYAWFATMNALFGMIKSWKAETTVFPAVTYTDPEVARVGLSEQEARDRGIAFEITRYELAELDRAIADGANEGFIKVLTRPNKDRILGVTIVGARAGDMLGEFTLAMRHGLGLNAILRTVHPYPGWTEAAKAVSGEWRRAHAPSWVLSLSGRFLRWRRG